MARTGILTVMLLLAGVSPGAADDPHMMTGIASVYSKELAVGRTASGERNKADGLTAAHRTLPFGTLVRVVNQKTGQSVIVRINDRGPFIKARVIDLSPAAAKAIGMLNITPVELALVPGGGLAAQALPSVDVDGGAAAPAR